MVTPPLDLSSTTTAALRWANDFIDNESGSIAQVDVSLDGGANWTNVWEASTDLPEPGTQTVDMSFAAGHAGVQARFHYHGFWAWWWQVDNVEIGAYACSVTPGGLVVGTVSDANTGAGLNGATVLTLPDDGSATTFSTVGGDGFYALFAGSGSQSFRASGLPRSLTKATTVIPNSTVARISCSRRDSSRRARGPCRHSSLPETRWI